MSMPDQTGGGPSSIRLSVCLALHGFLIREKGIWPCKGTLGKQPTPAQDLVMPAIQETFGVRGSFGGGEGAPRAQLEEPLLGSAELQNLWQMTLDTHIRGGGCCQNSCPMIGSPGLGVCRSSELEPDSKSPVLFLGRDPRLPKRSLW